MSQLMEDGPIPVKPVGVFTSTHQPTGTTTMVRPRPADVKPIPLREEPPEELTEADIVFDDTNVDEIKREVHTGTLADMLKNTP